jgi:drug/metabolite transporter (DMT)-like permease
LTQCTEPVFTVAASFFILGERLSGTGWCGGAILLVCIIYGNAMENTAGNRALLAHSAGKELKAREVER